MNEVDYALKPSTTENWDRPHIDNLANSKTTEDFLFYLYGRLYFGLSSCWWSYRKLELKVQAKGLVNMGLKL